MVGFDKAERFLYSESDFKLMVTFMFRILSLLFTLMGLLTSTGFAKEPAKPLQPITVSLGYHVDPCQGPVLYALVRGLFERHGLKVTLTPASGGEESRRQVAMKRVDIGIGKSANHVVCVVDKKLPLRKIGTLVGKPLEVLIVPKEMTDLKDLKGKKIGYNTSNPTFSMVVLDKILKSQGLRKSDVTLIAFQKGLIQAFLSGQVDGVFTSTIPQDTITLEKFGKAFTLHSYESFGVPPFEQFIYFTHKDHANDAFVAPFLAAVREATKAIKKDPAAAWHTLCNAYPELKDPITEKIWYAYSALFEDDPASLHVEHLQKLYDFLRAYTLDGKPVLKALESAPTL